MYWKGRDTIESVEVPRLLVRGLCPFYQTLSYTLTVDIYSKVSYLLTYIYMILLPHLWLLSRSWTTIVANKAVTRKTVESPNAYLKYLRAGTVHSYYIFIGSPAPPNVSVCVFLSIHLSFKWNVFRCKLSWFRIDGSLRLIEIYKIKSEIAKFLKH